MEAAEQGRGAIQSFKPTTATGQKALQEILQKNTGKGWLQTAKQTIGFSPKTDYIGSLNDFNSLSSAEQAARFGAEAPKVGAFLKQQAAWQVGKMLTMGATLATIGKITGVNNKLLHLVIGGAE